MFKKGDRVRHLILKISGEISYYDTHQELFVIEFKWDRGHDADKGDGARNRWFLYEDEVILESVYNSPLYQLMRENND